MRSKKTVIHVQQEQLHEFQDAVETSIKYSVKTAITTWSNIVKKNVTSAAPYLASVQKAVRSAEEANVCSSNFIIYGDEEDETDEYDCGLENSANLASRMFNEVGAFPKPVILTQKSQENASSRKPRPIKVTLASPEAVKFLLNKARKLR